MFCVGKALLAVSATCILSKAELEWRVILTSRGKFCSHNSIISVGHINLMFWDDAKHLGLTCQSLGSTWGTVTVPYV